ncbi:MAG: 4Fe-4S dicluster domain-containing protein [Desulfobacteraceae bacterium]|nr:4Fe-4S dicluster domain-containing protein [Desulfobacteraceae bacterium]MBC2756892.1 4Fe-4S dicluster domain-containing protein [Desulfobacteraceae bacterium]
MKTVKIKKGWQFKITGKPSQRIEERPANTYVASLPEKIPFVKPRLHVQKGDNVKIGSVLFEDKKHSDLKFLSPGSGRISDINYGPRRVIQEVVIALDDNETHEPFNVYSEPVLDEIDRNTLISRLMSGGMWPFIRQLPFRQIADPDFLPNAVWVTLGSADPFQPSAQVYLKDQADFFESGIKAIRRLADTVSICRYDETSDKNDSAANMVTHRILGKYPASDPGVVLYHTKKTASENQDWYIDGQDVIHIGKFLKTGAYPTDRIVSFSDGSSENSFHLKTRMGVRLNDLVSRKTDNQYKRWIVGGVLSGYMSTFDNFLDLYHTSIMIIEESHESELFGFVRPGSKKLSNSRTVLSAASSEPLSINSDMHGEKRPCVNCGYCANICPVDIMPQFTYKSIDADEIEEALAYGLLDCVECGLCSFVCPSKIELSDFLINAKHRYHKELNQIV